MVVKHEISCSVSDACSRLLALLSGPGLVFLDLWLKKDEKDQNHLTICEVQIIQNQSLVN